MNFTTPQIILLALGIILLYAGIDGGISGTLVGAGFCITAISLCYRKWWEKKPSTVNDL